MATSFGEIVALAKDRTTGGRRRMAVQFSEAFLVNSSQFSAKERLLALEILAVVLRDATLELRCELSQRLAREPGVPKKLVQVLANDVIEVAQSVLQHSDALEEDDLLEVVARRSTAHRVAIARRADISASVVEALAQKQELPVATALLRNIAIYIPEAALQVLALQALENGEIGEAIAQRSELTAEIAERIYWIISAELKAQIKSRFDLDGVKLDRIFDETIQLLAARQSNPATRRNVAQRLLDSGRVDAGTLLSLLKSRGTDLFKELLGGLTRFEPRVIDILCQTQCAEPLALVCRALGYAKTETASLLMLVHDRVAGQTQFDPASLADALTTFSRLTVGDAKTVLWQWQSDPDYLLSLGVRRPTGDMG